MKLYWKLLRAKNLDAVIDIADSYVFHGDIEKIIEVTYSYREIEGGNVLNETLFEEYTELAFPKHDISHLGRVCKLKLQLQVLTIEKIIKKAKSLRTCSRAESLRRGMFIDALNYTCVVLENAITGLIFELEKAGISHNLILEQVETKISQIEEREKQLFGKKMLESIGEFSSCYNFMDRNHIQRQKKLSSKDKKSMDVYLSILKKSFTPKIIETSSKQHKKLKGDFSKKEIERKDYRKIFDLTCELYGLPQRTKLTNAGSIYDGDDFLEIPRNSGFQSLSLDRVLKLITHEIESHYINLHNGGILLGNFRGAKNLPKEEGLAMFMERILVGYDCDSIDRITEIFFPILGGEILDGDIFQDFMRIMGQEYNYRNSYFDSFLRAKRNYSIHHAGVQHKDVVYFRGLHEMVLYLKSGKHFSKLFLGKVGFHDVENIYDIYMGHSRKDEIVFPIFLSEIIYYFLSKKKQDLKFVFNVQTYYMYVKKKYWFLDLADFQIVYTVAKKWKEIEKILKIFEKYL